MKAGSGARAGTAAFLMVALMLCGLLAATGCGKKGNRRDSGKQSAVAESKLVVEVGDRVQMQYRGTLDDGTVFDESPAEQPLEFIVGGGRLIPGFGDAMIGMKLNEEKIVAFTPEDAYGEWDEGKIMYLSRDDLPDGYKPEEGMGIGLQDGTGRPVPGTIVLIGQDSVKVDLNHPLAGKNLTFEIKVISIWGPPAEDLEL